MQIEFSALDTWFFRDGKPFNKSDDSEATSMSLPFPSTIFGALRSASLANSEFDLDLADTHRDPTKNLIINKIVLRRNGENYCPLPLDCVSEKDGENNTAELLELLNLDNYSNCHLSKILSTTRSGFINVPTGLLTFSEFQDYLSGKKKQFIFSKIDEFLSIETKTGIAIDAGSGAAGEHNLYNIDMIRPNCVCFHRVAQENPLSIRVSFDNLSWNKENITLGILGGEKKAVSLSYPEKEIEQFEFPDFGTGKIFKIVLLTPAIFNNGWLPRWIDEERLIGSYMGLRLQLLTTAIGKPQFIGGYDMKVNKPKQMRKAVPAGSVYYFKILSGNPESVKTTFHEKSVSDQMANQGFGITVVGKAIF